MSPLRKKCICTTLVLFISVISAQGKTQEPEYKEKSDYGPVQKRVFEMNHEFALGWSYLPLDPYYKGYGLSISYTIHFDNLWALELFRVGASYNLDTPLKRHMIDQLPTTDPLDFQSVVLFENTNLIYKFLYGKHTFLNRSVLHYEVFATGGGAFVFQNPFNFNKLDMENGRYELGIDFGLGFRVWLSESWSFRVDVRDTLLIFTINRPGDLPFDNSIEIGVAIAVSS